MGQQVRLESTDLTARYQNDEVRMFRVDFAWNAYMCDVALTGFLLRAADGQVFQ